ncbi:fimbrial protein [Erwinia phyllosphaerae]|uniref:fimbrial protein n=1 Tax=Erwinia phyllosphaerae TaxID=2853256 RepID=UPI001FEE8E79|nr:fimbrial protein [Erwinia phyllosphaerae]MBV4367411.1 type 1 fimbrial protein [Erwinia phyllosphaerae]
MRTLKRKWHILIVFLLPVFYVSADTNCTSCSISVLFQGTYTDETCIISINGGTYTETVSLPPVSVASLDKDGNEAGSRQFAIALKQCPADRTVAVTFISNLSSADTITGNLLNTVGEGYSQHVQIRIRKENGSRIIIDNASSGQDYQISSSGSDVNHYYRASYYAKGSAVTAGNIRAIAGVELVYK